MEENNTQTPEEANRLTIDDLHASLKNLTEQAENSDAPVKPQLTPEQQMMSLRGVAQMKHKAYDDLVTMHLRILLAEVLDTRASQNKRIQAASAIEQAFRVVLDAGVDITNPKTTVTGHLLKKAANFAGTAAQALDNKMLLLAQKMNEEKIEETKENSVTRND